MKKMLKRSIAVLLAVLMVAFSVPFTALAAEPVDSGMKVHFYAIGYDTKGGVLVDSNYYSDNEEVKYYDTRNMKLSDVEGDKNMFAIMVTVDSNSTPTFGAFLTWDYDTNYIKPAYWSTKTKVVTDYPTATDANKKNMIASLASDYITIDNTGTTSVQQSNYGVAYNTAAGKNVTFGSTQSFGDLGYDLTVEGTIIGVFGFQLVQDCDLADVISIRPENNFTAITIDNDDRSGDIMVYGATENAATHVPPTAYFTIPELGLAPQSGSTETEYTFTPLFGDPVKVMVPEGTDPLTKAPTLTPDETTYTHDAGASTHTKNTYSWVADGTNAYKEVKTPDTQPCDYKLTNETNSTCKDKGYKEYTCSVCTDSYKDYKNLADHDYSKFVSSTAGDCQHIGTTTYECSYGCGKTKTVDGDYGAHTLVKHDAVPSTCTVAGNSEYYTCSVCGKMFSDADAANEISAIPALPLANHTYTNYKNNNNATCKKNATETATCDVCGTATDTREIPNSTVDHKFTVEESSTPGTCVAKATTTYSCAFGCGTTDVVEGALDPSNHAGTEVSADNAVAPTRKDAGKEADTICSACKAVIKEGAVIPALGVNVTVAGSALGAVTINDEAISDAVKNLVYASSYTLKATPAENAEFVGWMVGNRIVSTETTYTTNAFADVTYVPVFAEKSASTFTVTFMDSYGNVVKTVSSADIPTLTELPEATQYAGLVFDSWSMTLDEIKELKDSATVYANYKNDEAQTYTITADNCTITIDGVDSQGTATATYNTKVTVKANDGAEKTWKVNGAVAGFGAEYTFFCGSNVTITTEDVVAAKPVVSAVSMTKAADSYRVKFLATRSIPDGYKLVESGFVYGKAMAAEDLVLENVGKVVGTDNGTLKQMVCSNTSGDGQFAVNYGVKAMNQTACARAYIIYTNGVETTVDYSEAMIYTY